MDLDAIEVRVLGCLIEKQRTTPDAYPLSLNALRLACNQSTNRDPVVQYDEETIRGALHRLGRRRYTRLASGHSSRAAKYRHLLDDELRLDREEQAVLAVLMLRGPQTPGELKQRTERMQPFSSIDELNEVLTRLIDREMVAQLARRPGQKEERFMHRLSEDADDVDEPAGFTAAAPAAVVPPPPRRDERVEKLEGEVAALRAEVGELRAELTALRSELGA
ncbi:YceH family protein [Solirubrobacter soli]|uniref:YceH family protein n=1 Tax=Solirubrobacter soli TaxID=363832 RepID=UPI00041FA857|nr:YceH family protein [Solirubrobacter soli]